MKKAVIALLGIVLFLSGCTYRCFHPVRYDSAYRGKIVDAATGEPIEGVVVLAVWHRSLWSPGGAVTKYYDARETVTDKDGEFEIPGKGILLFSNLEPTVTVLIFKAEYEYIGQGLWRSYLKSDDRVKWDGKKATFLLKKLSLEERKKRIGPPSPPHEARKNKIEKMLEEINKERREIGLDPIEVGREK